MKNNNFVVDLFVVLNKNFDYNCRSIWILKKKLSSKPSTVHQLPVELENLMESEVK